MFIETSQKKNENYSITTDPPENIVLKNHAKASTPLFLKFFFNLLQDTALNSTVLTEKYSQTFFTLSYKKVHKIG